MKTKSTLFLIISVFISLKTFATDQSDRLKQISNQELVSEYQALSKRIKKFLDKNTLKVHRPGTHKLKLNTSGGIFHRSADAKSAVTKNSIYYSLKAIKADQELHDMQFQFHRLKKKHANISVDSLTSKINIIASNTIRTYLEVMEIISNLKSISKQYHEEVEARLYYSKNNTLTSDESSTLKYLDQTLESIIIISKSRIRIPHLLSMFDKPTKYFTTSRPGSNYIFDYTLNEYPWDNFNRISDVRDENMFLIEANYQLDFPYYSVQERYEDVQETMPSEAAMAKSYFKIYDLDMGDVEDVDIHILF